MADSVELIRKHAQAHHGFIERLKREIAGIVIGQEALVERLLAGMLANGHILVEGLPGLAKTTAVRTLAQTLDCRFSRIQFTPDLLPADLIGTQVYNPADGSFEAKKGPVFAHIVLADEINRAPAKVQSALLEAMQERQATIGDETFPLEEPFMVLATQNPIEQEGTYPLPEAQTDRFMMKIKVSYPSRSEERELLERVDLLHTPMARPVVTRDELLRAREVVNRIYVDGRARDYLLDIVRATRNPEQAGLPINHLIEYGASPRATLHLQQAARALAFLRGEGNVYPSEIKRAAPDVLRHRIVVTYEAEAQGLSSDDIINRILDTVPVP